MLTEQVSVRESHEHAHEWWKTEKSNGPSDFGDLRKRGGLGWAIVDQTVFNAIVITINVYQYSDVGDYGLVSYCRSNVKKATTPLVNGEIVSTKKVFGLQKKPTRIVYVSKLKWTTTWLVWTKVYFIFFHKIFYTNVKPFWRFRQKITRLNVLCILIVRVINLIQNKTGRVSELKYLISRDTVLKKLSNF